MKIKEDICSITYIKTHIAKILSQVNKTKQPVYLIQKGEVKAVLVDYESFQGIIESLGVMKLLSPEEKDIDEKKLLRRNQVFNIMENKLKIRQ